jgi:ribosomal protein L36
MVPNIPAVQSRCAHPTSSIRDLIEHDDCTVVKRVLPVAALSACLCFKEHNLMVLNIPAAQPRCAHPTGSIRDLIEHDDCTVVKRVLPVVAHSACLCFKEHNLMVLNIPAAQPRCAHLIEHDDCTVVKRVLPVAAHSACLCFKEHNLMVPNIDTGSTTSLCSPYRQHT